MRVDDRRAGSWSRQQARRIHLEFLRERWRPLAALIATLLASIAIVVATVPNRFATFVAGAGIASVAWHIAMIVVQLAGTTRYMLGRHGEEWTAEALRPLRRHGWHLMNHIPLSQWQGDVDHVVVGPGGVYAIETKATGGEWDLDKPDQWLLCAVSQARYVSERVRKLLLEVDIQVKTEVVPLLVLWGQVDGSATHVDGVRVIHGADLASWRDELPSEGLPSDSVDRAAAGLQRIITTRDEHIRKTQGRPPLLIEVGPLGLLSQVSTGLLGGFLMFGLLGVLLTVLPDDALVPLLVVAVAAGLIGLRSRTLRLFATGWLAMSLSLGAVVLGLYLWVWAAGG